MISAMCGEFGGALFSSVAEPVRLREQGACVVLRLPHRAAGVKSSLMVPTRRPWLRV